MTNQDKNSYTFFSKSKKISERGAVGGLIPPSALK